MKSDELKIERTSREVIEDRLLTELSDGKQVAILADKETLDRIICALGCALEYRATDDREVSQLERDLMKLREAAFGKE